MMRSRLCAVGCILLVAVIVLVSESCLFHIYPALGASQPQILLTTRTPLDPPPGLGVNVTCLILDKYGLVNVSLFFSINNATQGIVKMQIIDGDFYTGTFLYQIPAQSLDAYVEYYVVATDTIGYHVQSSNESYRVSYDDTAPAFLSVTRIKPSGDPVLPGESVEIEALVADNGSGVKNATLWFGESQDPYEANFSAVKMNKVSGDDWNCTYVGVIPSYPNGTRILYYVSAADNSNNQVTQNAHTPYYVSSGTTSYLTVTINVLNVDMNNLTATINVTLDALLPSQTEPDHIQVDIKNSYSYRTDNETHETLTDSPIFVQVNSSSTRFSYHRTVNWNVHLIGSPNNYPFDNYYLNLTCTVYWSQPSGINNEAYFGDFRLYSVWSTEPAFQWYSTTNEYPLIIVSTLTLTRSSASVLPLTLLIQVLFFVLGGTMLVDPTRMLNERVTVFLAILVFSAGFFFSLNSVVPYRLGFTVGELLILSIVVGSGAFTLVSFLSRSFKSLLRGHWQIIGIVMDSIAALLLTWWLSGVFSDVPIGYWILLVIALWYGLTMRVAIGGMRWISTRRPPYDPRLYE
jgi:hypothetical protein